MNKQEKLSAIYEAIADKSLYMGCLMNNPHQNPNNAFYTKTFVKSSGGYHYCVEHNGNQSKFNKDVLIIKGNPVMIGDVLEWIEKNILDETIFCKNCSIELKIDNCNVGCPYTGDDKYIDTFYCEKCGWDSISDKDFENCNTPYIVVDDLIFGNTQENGVLWKQKRLPIDSQSDECIDYVFSLLSTHE